jgi:uncharacterized membrane protein (DUF485 family)
MRNRNKLIFISKLKKGSTMNDELVERIESNPKYKELLSKRNSLGIKLGIFVLVMFYAYILVIAFNKELLAAKIGDGVTTIAFPIALAILIISFITTLIYVRRANGEFEDLTNEIKKDVKDLI